MSRWLAVREKELVVWQAACAHGLVAAAGAGASAVDIGVLATGWETRAGGRAGGRAGKAGQPACVAGPRPTGSPPPPHHHHTHHTHTHLVVLRRDLVAPVRLVSTLTWPKGPSSRVCTRGTAQRGRGRRSSGARTHGPALPHAAGTCVSAFPAEGLVRGGAALQGCRVGAARRAPAHLQQLAAVSAPPQCPWVGWRQGRAGQCDEGPRRGAPLPYLQQLAVGQLIHHEGTAGDDVIGQHLPRRGGGWRTGWVGVRG